MIFLILLIIIALAFIGFGGYMFYSVVTGKGIPDPGPNALLKSRVQYKLRGLIGGVFIFIGTLIFIGILNCIERFSRSHAPAWECIGKSNEQKPL
jgi:hypothetical protein